MLHIGAIEHGQSEWSSPVVLVPKSDETLRPCIDYRKVNQRFGRCSVLHASRRAYLSHPAMLLPGLTGNVPFRRGRRLCK